MSIRTNHPMTDGHSRRTWLALALGGLATLATRSRATASGYPARPVQLVVPYAAGGGADLLSRRMAGLMARHLGGSVVVENRVGAAGVVAAQSVAQAAPDGHTLLIGASTHVAQKALNPAVPFDPLRDFTHVVRTSSAQSVLVVPADSPWRTLEDLLRDVRSAPGRFNYASGGIGSTAHLAGMALATAARLNVVHVPYRGSVDIIPSLLARDTQFAFPVQITAQPLIEQGKVRALAVSGERRSPRLPGVATLAELMSDPQLVVEGWSGIWVPSGTPAAVVRAIEDTVRTTMADPELVAASEALGLHLWLTRSPAEFTDFVRSESVRYASWLSHQVAR